MTGRAETLVRKAIELAARMPLDSLQVVAQTIETSANSSQARARIAANLAHPGYKDQARQFLDHWDGEASALSPQDVAMALHTAALAHQVHREQESVELAWTGPDAQEIPLRKTEQSILEVINRSQERLTVVSYAVYAIQNIREALVGAAERGVEITVILETPHKLEGRNQYDTIRAIGTQVQQRVSLYYWPEEKRPRSNTDEPGKLHVKCVVADGRQLFLSSANLTEHAFHWNMELGVLITGGALPSQVESHFRKLIVDKALIEV